MLTEKLETLFYPKKETRKISKHKPVMNKTKASTIPSQCFLLQRSKVKKRQSEKL